MSQIFESNPSNMFTEFSETCVKSEVDGNDEETSMEERPSILNLTELNGKYQMIYTEYVNAADSNVGDGSDQHEILESDMYTIHIQEDEHEVCKEEEPMYVEESNTVTYTVLENFNENKANPTIEAEIRNTESEDQVSEKTNSNCVAELNCTSLLDSENEELNPESNCLFEEFIEEEAYALHGLDISLPVMCDTCNINFDNMMEFDKHMRTHIETRFFMCQFCSKTYASWQNLVAHRKACHSGQFISCENCTNRKIHYDLGPINFPVGKYTIGCEECDTGFETLNELHKHYRCHSLCYPGTSAKCNRRENNGETLKINKTSNEEISDNDICNIEGSGNILSQANATFWCDSCQKEMSSVTYYRHKKSDCDLSLKYKCPYCLELISDPIEYKNRRIKRNIMKQCVCKFCNEKFIIKATLDVDKYDKSITKNFKCFNCQLNFATSPVLSQHIETVHSQSPDVKLICDICTSTHSCDKFMEHYLSCRSQPKSEKSAKLESCVCKICDKVFSNHKTLSRHLQNHVSDFPVREPYLCEECGMMIQNTGPFIAHIRSHGKEHSRNAVELNENCKENNFDSKEKKMSFLCEHCGKAFKYRCDLKVHTRRHRGEKPYCCILCTMAFYTEKQLSVHMRQHTGERPYVCLVCGKSFASTSVFHAHRRLHNSIRQHSCPICGKKFLWRSSYHNHIRTHSTVRPYKCNECPRAFLFKCKLAAHKRNHEKQKEKLRQQSLQCTDCEKVFLNAAELQSHHEDKCYLTMITFMQPEKETVTDMPLSFLNCTSTFSEEQEDSVGNNFCTA